MIIKMSLCFNNKITGVYLSVLMEALSNLNLMLLSFVGTGTFFKFLFLSYNKTILKLYHIYVHPFYKGLSWS
jgi:hypothetical protein